MSSIAYGRPVVHEKNLNCPGLWIIRNCPKNIPLEILLYYSACIWPACPELCDQVGLLTSIPFCFMEKKWDISQSVLFTVQ